MLFTCPACSQSYAAGPCPRCGAARAAALRTAEHLLAHADTRTPYPDRSAAVLPAPLISSHFQSTPHQAVLSGEPSHHDAESSTPELQGPKEIPGYLIEKVIGNGGMGTVYLARQLSLDRPVALKIMSKIWASDPVFVARFIREAYAAAMLNHPNVVQIHDIGECDGTRYFSMEYVDGKSLADLVKAGGKLDPELAVNYALQAARGLQHAHERGIIHRDVKPENLLLDPYGVVKVADLGLVKTPDMTRLQDRLADDRSCSDSGLHTLPAEMTGVRMALGTPAYMAPEQCRDAATVDHRADIYSLGCTLYTLVTGRPPFHASDSVGLMKKHAYETPTPPEVHSPRLPRELSAIILRMMAKLPGDRYKDFREVIRILEGWLGTTDAKTQRYTAREEQISEIEAHARRFRTAPTAALRERSISTFMTGSALAALLLVVFGKSAWAFGVAGMAVQATLVYFVLSGWSGKTYLFRRVRQLCQGLSYGDWLVISAGIGLFGAFLWMSKLITVWVGFGLFGAAAAFSLWYILDRKLAAERYETLRAMQLMVRQMRRQGVADEDTRLTVAKYSGRHWEAFFEAIFGFEAKLQTREILRGGSAGKREKHAAWREPIVHLINAIEAAKKKTRDRALLERSEYQRLVAGGYTPRMARKQASAVADELVEHADLLRDGTDSAISMNAVPSISQITGGFVPEPQSDRVGAVIDWLVGPAVRAILAGVLLAACGLWIYQNDLLRLGWTMAEGPPAPLTIDGIAAEWTDWCDTINVGWSGMLLVASLLFRGQRMGALAILGAGVTVLGHKFGIRTVEPIRDYHVAMMVGTVLALVGYRLGRR